MSLIIEIKVFSSSGTQKFVLDSSGLIKCYIKSQAEKGKANKEVIEFLSEFLDIPKYNISIISGLTTPRKKIKIAQQLTQQELFSKLGFK
jgi:uncharacterized protein (TIGR00251 family)